MAGIHAVVDSSVLLAVFFREADAAVASQVGRGAAVSAVNAAEIASRMADKGSTREHVDDALQSMTLRIVPFDYEDALAAGMLQAATRSVGISLGDCACLALARRLALPVFTADRRWAKLKIGIDIRVIR